MEIAELERRISTQRDKPLVEPSEFAWFEFNTPKVRKINEALYRSEKSERFDLTKALWKVYSTHGNEEDTRRIFGDINPLYPERLMATLSGDGREFRLWHSLPKYLGFEHVDCCGQGLILNISSNEKPWSSKYSLEKYSEELTKGLNHAIFCSSNVKIWMKSLERRPSSWIF